MSGTGVALNESEAKSWFVFHMEVQTTRGQKYYAVFHEEHQRISFPETLYFFYVWYVCPLC